MKAAKRFTDDIRPKSEARLRMDIQMNELQPWQRVYGNVLMHMNESFDGLFSNLVEAAGLQESDQRLEARIEAEYDAILSGVPEDRKNKFPSIDAYADSSPVRTFQDELTSCPSLFSAIALCQVPKKIQQPLRDAFAGEDQIIEDAFKITKLKALADLLKVQVLGRLLSYNGSHVNKGEELTAQEAEKEYRERESVVAKALMNHMVLSGGITEEKAMLAVDDFKKAITIECDDLIKRSGKDKHGIITVFEEAPTKSLSPQLKNFYNDAAEMAAEPIKALPVYLDATDRIVEWAKAHPNSEPHIQDVLRELCHVYRTYKPTPIGQIEMQNVRAFLHMQPSDALCHALEKKAAISVALGKVSEVLVNANRLNDTKVLQAERELRRLLVHHGAAGSYEAHERVKSFSRNFAKLTGPSAIHKSSGRSM